jgi:hypothetical protein
LSQADQQHAEFAVFAADGGTRHRLVRAGIAAGVLILVGWLVALALGVLGGFESLPSLPDRSASDTSRASAKPEPAGAPTAATQSSRKDRANEDIAAGDGANAQQPASQQAPAVRKPRTPPAPSVTTATTTTTKPGKRLGTTSTQTSGKPLGSPGNGPGGTGPPGHNP